jgi:hypothetical protein
MFPPTLPATCAALPTSLSAKPEDRRAINFREPEKIPGSPAGDASMKFTRPFAGGRDNLPCASSF